MLAVDAIGELDESLECHQVDGEGLALMRRLIEARAYRAQRVARRDDGAYLVVHAVVSLRGHAHHPRSRGEEAAEEARVTRRLLW